MSCIGSVGVKAMELLYHRRVFLRAVTLPLKQVLKAISMAQGARPIEGAPSISRGGSGSLFVAACPDSGDTAWKV